MTKNEISPFYIKHQFNLNVCCHISCPSNMAFARPDPGLWEMAKYIWQKANEEINNSVNAV
jgi:hypothetical protein